MFLIAAVILIIFALFYGLFSLAVIYHLRQYTPPGNKSPRMVITFFIFFSLFFLTLAVTFLLKIPS